MVICLIWSDMDLRDHLWQCNHSFSLKEHLREKARNPGSETTWNQSSPITHRFGSLIAESLQNAQRVPGTRML